MVSCLLLTLVLMLLLSSFAFGGIATGYVGVALLFGVLLYSPLFAPLALLFVPVLLCLYCVCCWRCCRFTMPSLL